MKSRKSVTLAILLTFLMGVMAGSASAETITVPGDFIDAIQDAVDSAGIGGTVILGGGRHVMTQTVVIDIPGIRIASKDGAKIIGRNATAGTFLPLFEITAIDVALTGLNAQAGPLNVGDLSLAVATGAHKLDIFKCRLTDFVQIVDAADSASVDVQSNRIDAVHPLQDGGTAGNRAVILVAGTGNTRIGKNKMEGPRGEGTAGIVCLPGLGSFYELTQNKITGFDTGVVCDGAGDARIRRNKIVQCLNGMDLAETTVANAWMIDKNKVLDNLAAGIYLQDGESCDLFKNLVKASGTDGINIGGVLNTVQRNKTRLNAGSGIYAESASCNFIKNRSVRNGTGIRIEGSANRLKKNKANRNIGAGILATGGNVKLAGNRGKKNGGVNVSIS